MKKKVIATRFARAFISGALSTATWVSVGDVSGWTDLATALNRLVISLLIGGVTGVLMAGDKLIRWKEEV